MQALQVVAASTVSELPEEEAPLPPEPPPLLLLLLLLPHEARARALLAQPTIALLMDVQEDVLRHHPYTPVATQLAHVL